MVQVGKEEGVRGWGLYLMALGEAVEGLEGGSGVVGYAAEEVRRGEEGFYCLLDIRWSVHEL